MHSRSILRTCSVALTFWPELRAELSFRRRAIRAILRGILLPRARDASDVAACAYLRSVGGYGTIVFMADRRVRLSAEDTTLVVAALRARAAMTRGMRRHRLERLAERLAEGVRGNPKWIHSEFSQTHEEDLEDEGDE